MRLKTGTKKVLVIPDLQIPFHHRDAFAFLEAVRDHIEPDEVVCIGDETDQYMLSRYIHSPEAMSASKEQQLTSEYLKDLYKIFPDVKACLSNHTDRVIKRSIEAGIPKHYMKDVKEFMEAPNGWNWATKWEIDGVIYEHGEAAGGQQPHKLIAQANHKSTVIGHHHSVSGIEYFANHDTLLWGMCVGCLIDIDSYAFAYAKSSRGKPILSCGIVVDGVPAIIPMATTKAGRWTNNL